MTVAAKIESIEDRLAALEAARCRCASCVQAEQAASLRSRIAAQREVGALPIAERVAALLAMTPMDRALWISGAAPSVAIETLVALPERDRIAALAITPRYSRLVAIELVEAPHHARMTCSIRWQRSSPIKLAAGKPELLAEARRVLALAGESSRLSAWTDEWGSPDGRQVLRVDSWSQGSTRVMIAELAALLPRLDPELASAIASGQIVVHEYSPDEDRAHLREIFEAPSALPWRLPWEVAQPNDRRPVLERRRKVIA